MTKPLDPEIKAIRAMNRALASLPEVPAQRRVLEWLVAYWLNAPWFRLPEQRQKTVVEREAGA